MNIISIQDYYDNVIVEVIKESIIGTQHKLKINVGGNNYAF